MARPKPGKSGRKGGDTRADRLKAALKANLARRKAQTRARQTDADGKPADKG